MSPSCIYLISTTIDNRIYIGSAKNFSKRKAMHVCMLRQNRHHSPHLQRFFNKYGLDGLEFTVIALCDTSDLIPLEQKYIDIYKPEFNGCKIAGSTTGIKNTEDQKRKISNKLKGALNPFYGKSHTQQTRDKMRSAWRCRTVKPHSDETKHKIRLTKIGALNPMARRVVQLKGEVLIAEYGSAAECARALSVSHSAIKNTIGRSNRKCRGFTFRHAS